MVKVCGKCNIEKEFTEFYKNKTGKHGLTNQCKFCIKEYQEANKEQIREYKKEYDKKYRQDNKERIKEYKKEYGQDNKERIRERNKEYYHSNKEYFKEYFKEYSKEYRKQRKKTDPLYKLKCNLSTRTYYAFKRKGYSKNTKTQEILGAKWETVKQHIESRFIKGMNWNNHGKWHIDHIIPLSVANSEKELLKLCHYTNLQPLWAEDNLSKGSKLIACRINL